MRRIGARGFTRGPESAWRRASLVPAARRHRNLSQPFHDDDLYGSPALLLFQGYLGDDGAFPARYVPGRDPVQGEGEHILPAEIAPAECGEMWSQGLVRRGDVIFHQILDHRTANAGGTTAPAETTEPVKVDPVLPVRRTWW